jgi:hypothetical protein
MQKSCKLASSKKLERECFRFTGKICFCKYSVCIEKLIFSGFVDGRVKPIN